MTLKNGRRLLFLTFAIFAFLSIWYSFVAFAKPVNQIGASVVVVSMMLLTALFPYGRAMADGLGTSSYPYPINGATCTLIALGWAGLASVCTFMIAAMTNHKESWADVFTSIWPIFVFFLMKSQSKIKPLPAVRFWWEAF